MTLYRYLLVALLLGLSTAAARAQKAKPRPAAVDIYQAVDAKMKQVPDSSARTVGGLVRYINAAFTTEADKARAAFGWVARNIRYDVANMYSLDFTRESDAVVQETLTKRVGVCRHYAELYSALANAVGVKTYVVTGFVRHTVGVASPLQHAWCATRIDGQWTLMDPTWSSGYVDNNRFVAYFSNDFYRAKPTAFIRTHMPFDPLWQLLPTPRTAQHFYQGLAPAPAARPFAVADSIAVYEKQGFVERLHASNRRIEHNGVRNDHIYSYLAANIILEENYNIGLLNQAQNFYNDGVNTLSGFYDYFNRQFQPKKTDAELQQILPPIADNFAQARTRLSAVHFHDATYKTSARQLEQLLREAEGKLQNSQEFMARYLRTGKLLRPTLFMNISTLNGQHEMMR
ncbi:hypothetical protein E5K00_14170 [Hymenobacter aquaticus]|uniref:Transglutaminase-like domain-containing protein n=1 Tax=Hymenobacter aquaticus TaxID=1867101 RepID=A0A4Z0PVT7_9BACT|nr:transglutaminase domain-containing protein [Hymenobacter aquaticus]TGE21429.1 hypothetical protein E5K00_14170 [Hymenobacter aquaticus]